MTIPYVRKFSAPDEVMEAPGVRSEIVLLAGVRVGHDSHEPGWRWSTHLKDLVGTESCLVRHLGVCVGGSLAVVLDDGTEYQIDSGDVYHIPPGHDGWVVGDEPFVCVEWMGTGSWIAPVGALSGRVLATLVFTDIDGSTAQAQELGDRAWLELLTAYEGRSRDTLVRYRGREVKQTGDGILATFDSAGGAVSCAVELRQVALDLGLSVRAAVHTGEIELGENDVHGLAVHETARILEEAAAGEILVSAATKDLAGYLRLVFEDRGERELRGIRGSRRLFAVDQPDIRR